MKPTTQLAGVPTRRISGQCKCTGSSSEGQQRERVDSG